MPEATFQFWNGDRVLVRGAGVKNKYPGIVRGVRILWNDDDSKSQYRYFVVTPGAPGSSAWHPSNELERHET